ncbi:MAG: hypothetical protein OEZ43_12810 [Gammaproteobacteria bacterium]|nr:hypothetical protein [Gammaproteobacteria bacterium]
MLSVYAFSVSSAFGSEETRITSALKYWSMQTNVSSQQYLSEVYQTAHFPGLTIAVSQGEWFGGINLSGGDVHSSVVGLDIKTQTADVDLYLGYYFGKRIAAFVDAKFLSTKTELMDTGFFTANTNSNIGQIDVGVGGGISAYQPLATSLLSYQNLGLLLIDSEVSDGSQSSAHKGVNLTGEIGLAWLPQLAPDWRFSAGYKYRQNVLLGSLSGSAISEHGLIAGLSYTVGL